MTLRSSGTLFFEKETGVSCAHGAALYLIISKFQSNSFCLYFVSFFYWFLECDFTHYEFTGVLLDLVWNENYTYLL